MRYPCFALPLMFVLFWASAITAADNTLSPEEQAAGWQLLFDGHSAEHWVNYRSDTLSDGWQVVDGELRWVSKQAGDIVTRQHYRDFEFSIDWNISKQGNSGIFLKADPTVAGPIFKSAIEMQVLDNTHPAAKSGGPASSNQAGACYGLYAVDPGIAKPPGEWNTARIISKGQHVQLFLNGQKTADFIIGSDDWNQRVAHSKFKRWPGFGLAAQGPLGLQDHGNPVSFKNIKIRKLSSDKE